MRAYCITWKDKDGKRRDLLFRIDPLTGAITPEFDNHACQNLWQVEMIPNVGNSQFITSTVNSIGN